ncbi:TetR/AcrR family transcriptional regulator [Rhodococcus sp. ABRD24]|uniref:TetR family transcriptional regulator n=1 Tax=Rhodococcus sp. ABRD24 TaxID=2507582 RepID=UPI00103B2536|nr:TetR family transcriptional regulator [Rhodococcus sp. ABRD24]QBJ94665.1 TetR/AcrR family transcriptional regulator [Rhodococcus sp. ABRD24]
MASSSSDDSTRGRVLGAAKAEFARYGIAGARIDRIAKAARTSKERVYAYFRSKDELYQFVVAQELEAIAEATRMNPADLPGYAGRVHDYFVANPDNMRLMRWGQLELADSEPDDASAETANRKIGQLRRAQRDGLLDPSWNPLDILMFVNQLAMAWAGQPGVAAAEAAAGGQFLADRRAAIVAAVERLFPASTSP